MTTSSWQRQSFHSPLKAVGLASTKSNSHISGKKVTAESIRRSFATKALNVFDHLHLSKMKGKVQAERSRKRKLEA
jgi:hypothetical protein